MNAVTGSVDPVQAVEAADERPCLDVEGSKVYAEMGPDRVLVVRVYPAGDTPVAVLVDETLVAGSQAQGPRGRHHRQPPDPAVPSSAAEGAAGHGSCDTGDRPGTALTPPRLPALLVPHLTALELPPCSRAVIMSRVLA